MVVGCELVCVSQGLYGYFYLKTAETFPNKDDVTSIKFLSFIGIGSPYAPVKIKLPFFKTLPILSCSLTNHSTSDNISCGHFLSDHVSIISLSNISFRSVISALMFPLFGFPITTPAWIALLARSSAPKGGCH